jgi:hypothetical protein
MSTTGSTTGTTPIRATRSFRQAEAEAIHTRLAKLSLSELDTQFQAATAPEFPAIQGNTAGAWLAKPPQDYWWARWFIRVFLNSPWARWSGKGFRTSYQDGARGKGVNLFRNRFRPQRFPMDLYLAPSETDGASCLVIRYRPGSLMYGLIDEVRQLEEGVFLGQMLFKFPWRRNRLFIGYFVLCALAE